MGRDVAPDLRKYVKGSEAAQEVCRYLADRVKWEEVTPVRVIADKSGIDYYAAVEVMKAFGDLGLGRFWNGRKGMETRFEWWVHRVEAGKAGLGEADELELPDDEEDEDEDEVDVAAIIALHRKLISLTIGKPRNQITITIAA